MAPVILDLAAVGRSMLPTVGGKAANLGELIRAGLPVPPGICVTTEAYRQVADSAGIDFEALAAVLAWKGERLEFHSTRPDLHPTDPAQLRRAVDKRTAPEYVIRDVALGGCVRRSWAVLTTTTRRVTERGGVLS